MASLKATPGRKYDLGKMPCVGETLRRTLKHLVFRLGFTVAEEMTFIIVDFSVCGKLHFRGHTLSRISARFSASTGVSEGEPLGDCSARKVVEIMKGMSCAPTPSFARSSGAIGGRSGEGVLVSGLRLTPGSRILPSKFMDNGTEDRSLGGATATVFGVCVFLTRAEVGSRWGGVAGITS